jgi:hypothetical protein
VSVVTSRVNRIVDDVTWVKRTVNHRLAKSHGYYLQHAKESCLIGVKHDGSKCVPSRVTVLTVRVTRCALACSALTRRTTALTTAVSAIGCTTLTHFLL